jgi:hypothetical protein
MKVWIAETAYSDEGTPSFAGVFASLEAAVRNIKEKYPAPYVVKWKGPDKQTDGYALKGSFDTVLGYSSSHEQEWLITEHDVLQ